MNIQIIKSKNKIFLKKIINNIFMYLFAPFIEENYKKCF